MAPFKPLQDKTLLFLGGLAINKSAYEINVNLAVIHIGSVSVLHYNNSHQAETT